MKNHSKSKRKNQQVRQYFIPMTKNQFERKSFEQSVQEWVGTKFQFAQLFFQSQTQNKQDAEAVFYKKSKQLQNEFLLKHKIEELVAFFPQEYYQVLIKYVMQKKLYWTFKQDGNQQASSLILHKDKEVQLALSLKQHYKNYEYNQKKMQSIIAQKLASTSVEYQSVNLNRTSYKESFKKHNPDFLYDLLMMYSVSVVAAFFQHFVPELEIDKAFRSQIYIIVNHGFLDMEVSPGVYDIMEKKYCTNQNKRNFQSLNASYIHQFSSSIHKNLDKHSNNPDSNRVIRDDKEKSIGAIGNQTFNKFLKPQSKQRLEKNGDDSKHLSRLPSKQLSTSGTLTNNCLMRPAIKKQFFMKPTTSIGSCLPSDRQNNSTGKKNFKSHPNMHPSRFNSFMKDAKKIVIPPMLEQALDNGYLPTSEQIDFYSTLRNSLHVDALPPIKKKKMNINQYQKLSEADKIKEIKKQIKSIDQNSKKNHIMSNDISLAMNTFISTSFNFPKKQTFQRDLHIATSYDKKIEPFQTTERNTCNKSFIRSENKQNFQLKKLPLKASNLKFQLTKSCGFYAFDDGMLKLGQFSVKQSGQAKNNTVQVCPSIRKLNESEKNQSNNKFQFQQRNTKISTQPINFNQTLKVEEMMSEAKKLKEKETKEERKKQSEKRKCSRLRQSDILSFGSNAGFCSISSFKHIESNNVIESIKKRISKSKIEQDDKATQQRQSIMNNFGLSSKMQKFELGTREVTQIEMINENTNRDEDFSGHGILEGEVNIQKDVISNYKSLYKSFDLKKKLRDFEATCKQRQEISNHSVFNINTFKEPWANGIKAVKEQDEETSNGRLSESITQ